MSAAQDEAALLVETGNAGDVDEVDESQDPTEIVLSAPGVEVSA